MAAEDEDQAYQDEQNNYRNNVVKATNSKLWHTMVHISVTAKKPLVKFLFWGQKIKQQHNKLQQQALDSGTTYLGKTPLSEFVAWKAASVANEISDLLNDSAVEDQAVWGTVWDHCPVDMRQEALELIIASVLKALRTRTR